MKSGKKEFDKLTQEEIFTTSPEELMELLGERFRLEIPPAVESVSEMEQAGRLLGKCASEYSYLINMALVARLRKRQMKRSGADRKEVEDALSREEVFSNYADIMKTAYNAISRMITIKQQINDELRMTDGR